jgi:hypothetical protein
MSLKLRSTLTAGLLVAPLAVALAASSAAAASAHAQGAANTHHLHRANVAHRWHHLYTRQHYVGAPALHNLYNSVSSPSNGEDWPTNQQYPCSTSFCDPNMSNGVG